MEISTSLTPAQGSALFAGFLEKHGVSRRVAAAGLGVSKTTIMFWAKGAQRPELAHRTAIETWTSGAVPATSWVLPGEALPAKVKPLKVPRKNAA